MQLSDKLKEYLINSLLEKKESLDKEIQTIEKSIAQMGENNGKLNSRIEDFKLKICKLDEENCRLKKDKVKLEENFGKLHKETMNLITNHRKECEEYCEENQQLKNKIKELEEELLKKVIIECEPKLKGKPGRKPKEVK